MISVEGLPLLQGIFPLWLGWGTRDFPPHVISGNCSACSSEWKCPGFWEFPHTLGLLVSGAPSSWEHYSMHSGDLGSLELWAQSPWLRETAGLFWESYALADTWKLSPGCEWWPLLSWPFLSPFFLGPLFSAAHCPMSENHCFICFQTCLGHAGKSSPHHSLMACSWFCPSGKFRIRTSDWQSTGMWWIPDCH